MALTDKLGKAVEYAREVPRTLRQVIAECVHSQDPELVAEERAGATHEAGHSLLYILGEFPIKGVRISRFSSDTRKKLRDVLGHQLAMLLHSGVYADLDIVIDAPAEVFESELTLCDLAGVASEQTQPVRKKGVTYFFKSLEDIENTKWTDVTHPYGAIYRQYTAIAGRNPSREEMTSMMTEIFNQLTHIFEQPKFMHAISILSDYFLKHRTIYGSNLNPKLKEVMNDNGITQDDINAMQIAVLSMDIDTVILKYIEKSAA